MAPGPIRGLRFVHNAIRAQAAIVEDACNALQDPADAQSVREAVHTLTSAVRGHVVGEDEGYFPSLRERLPNAADAFQFDHDDEEIRLAELDQLADNCSSAEDLAALRRCAVVVREHLELHMTKEEEILWPQTEEIFSLPEQGAIVGAILQAIPKDQMPTLMPWLVERQTPDEAVAYMQMLEHVQPPEIFAISTGWVRDGVSPARWDELVSAIPDLA